MSNFYDLRRRVIEAQNEADRVRKILERRWVIDTTYLSPFSETQHPLEISFYISTWGEVGIPPMISVSGFDIGHDIGRLSARALRRIAAVKQLYEDYFAGKISEIPANLPEDIATLP